MNLRASLPGSPGTFLLSLFPCRALGLALELALPLVLGLLSTVGVPPTGSLLEGDNDKFLVRVNRLLGVMDLELRRVKLD